MNPKLLPTLMIVLSIGAAAVYAWQGDFRKSFYWICAAGLNIAVTY